MWPPPLVEVPMLHHVFQAARTVSTHALVVNLDGGHVQAPGSRRLYRIHVCKLLAHDAGSFSDPISLFIPDVGKALKCLCKPIGRSNCQDDLGSTSVWYIWMHVLSGELAKEGVERRISLRRAILQRRCQINLAKDVRLGRVMGDKHTRWGRVGLGSIFLCLRTWWLDGFVGCRLKTIWKGYLSLEGLVREVRSIRQACACS